METLVAILFLILFFFIVVIIIKGVFTLLYYLFPILLILFVVGRVMQRRRGVPPFRRDPEDHTRTETHNRNDDVVDVEFTVRDDEDQDS